MLYDFSFQSCSYHFEGGANAPGTVLLEWEEGGDKLACLLKKRAVLALPASRVPLQNRAWCVMALE